MPDLIQMGANSTKEEWRDNWQTPKYILEAVNKFWQPRKYPDRHDWYDPCPIGHIEDGLSKDWPERVYVNPPFSQYLEWAKKGIQEFTKKEHSDQFWPEQIWIMNYDSSTTRQKILMQHAKAVCMLDNRVQFIDPRTGEPSKGQARSQILLYLSPWTYYCADFRRSFEHLGKVLETV